MQDYERWGVLTIGTGLGNARFTNRRKAEKLMRKRRKPRRKKRPDWRERNLCQAIHSLPHTRELSSC